MLGENCEYAAISHLLDAEGGTVTEDDAGRGVTRLGISVQSFRDEGIDGVTDQDIRDMTWEQAYDFYKNHYWDRHRLSELGSCRVAALVLLNQVNFGHIRGTRLFQQALNLLGSALLEDGLLGPKTRTAACRVQQQSLQTAIQGTTIVHYWNLTNSNPDRNRQYLIGWWSRVQSVALL